LIGRAKIVLDPTANPLRYMLTYREDNKLLCREEFELSDLSMCIDMTYDSPKWDPTDERFEINKAAMVDEHGLLYDNLTTERRAVVSGFATN
jgi:hypothetical protein